MNGTNVNPAGAGSAATFVDNDCDANKRTITATWANFRALGLIPDSDKGSDASISFRASIALFTLAAASLAGSRRRKQKQA